jgi:hypothetical protein
LGWFITAEDAYGPITDPMRKSLNYQATYMAPMGGFPTHHVANSNLSKTGCRQRQMP